MPQFRALLGPPIVLACAALLRLRDEIDAWASLTLLLATVPCLLGHYRIARKRRRALIGSILLPASRLRHIFSGRAGAAISALSTTAVAALAAGHFVWTAEVQEVVLAAAMVLCLAGCQIALLGAMASHARPELAYGFAAGLAIALALAVFVPLHAWLSYTALPLPPHIDAQSISAAVEGALSEISGSGWLRTAFVSLHGIEAAILWALDATDFRFLFALIIYLLWKALVLGSVARLLVDAGAAFQLRQAASQEQPANG